MIVLRNVTLPLAHFTLDVDVEMNGTATALYGPYGSGKTSLIETIAGLRRPTRGEIVVNGRDLTHVPARDRRIGYVPQDDALFPHMTVRSNIEYGARGPYAPIVDVLEIGHILDRGRVHDHAGW